MKCVYYQYNNIIHIIHFETFKNETSPIIIYTIDYTVYCNPIIKCSIKCVYCQDIIHNIHIIHFET